MSGESNFLLRWSRLKRQAEAKRPDPADTSSDASDSDLSTKAVEEARPVLPELTPEELAALPRLEDITPDMDLSVFMRSGVPVSLRNAALRRMWVLDPAIRDRVGDALEYAYDWNIPGSVPGSGPLLPIDDVAAMLRSIAGMPAEEEVGADRSAEAQTPVTAASPAPPPAADSQPQEPLGLDHSPRTEVQASDRAESAKPKQEIQANAPSRRHGGATPF
ncbi:MAG: hypothetical protein QOH65_489 [Methylobacteriaceae bacterium]|jgi:hypothetical protein|nr:hypothetical protein [Methylobacteriaceae bacterium]